MTQSTMFSYLHISKQGHLRLERMANHRLTDSLLEILESVTCILAKAC